MPHVGENTSIYTGNLARLQCPIDGERRGGDLLTECHRHAVTDGAARYSSAVVQGHTTVYVFVNDL